MCAAAQTGCVIDCNAFSQAPRSDPVFGTYARSQLDEHAVEDMCTNPASLSGSSGPLISMYRSRLPTQQVAGGTTQGIFGAHPPVSSSPRVEYDDGYSAQCVTSRGYRVLMVKRLGQAPQLSAAPSAAWDSTSTTPTLLWATWYSA